jgi:hypothetical protein
MAKQSNVGRQLLPLLVLHLSCLQLTAQWGKAAVV